MSRHRDRSAADLMVTVAGLNELHAKAKNDEDMGARIDASLEFARTIIQAWPKIADELDRLNRERSLERRP